MNRLVATTSQFLIALFFYAINHLYPNPLFWKAFVTFLLLGLIYIVFRIVLQALAEKRVNDERVRYTSQKVLSILYFVTFLASIIAVWVEDTQSILVSYGIIGAGIAIALQDVFKNLAGGLLILTTGIYHVGDRIEVMDKTGDIVDIGIMYTTILELKEWVDADQPSGRLSIIPNAVAIDKVVNNFSKSYNFMWAELELPVTYDSNWRQARELILQVLQEVVGDIVPEAEKEMTEVMRAYYLKRVPVEPAVYMTLTDNWINLHIRYPVPATDRRVTNSRVYTRLMEEIEKRSDIRIASMTQTITIVHPKKVMKEGPQ